MGFTLHTPSSRDKSLTAEVQPLLSLQEDDEKHVYLWEFIFVHCSVTVRLY